MNAAVLNPRCWKMLARSRTSPLNGSDRLSRMPWSAGDWPVNSETWDGRVSGTGTSACGAQAPSRAS